MRTGMHAHAVIAAVALSACAGRVPPRPLVAATPIIAQPLPAPPAPPLPEVPVPAAGQSATPGATANVQSSGGPPTRYRQETVINFDEESDASMEGPALDIVEAHPAPAKFRSLINPKFRRQARPLLPIE